MLCQALGLKLNGVWLKWGKGEGPVEAGKLLEDLTGGLKLLEVVSREPSRISRRVGPLCSSLILLTSPMLEPVKCNEVDVTLPFPYANLSFDRVMALE